MKFTREWIAGYVTRLLDERGDTGLTSDERAQVVDLIANGLTSADLGVTVQPFDAAILKADETRELTAGHTAASYTAGIIDSGTWKPNPQLGLFQNATNGGAHTLQPPARNCILVLDYVNGATAGAIDTSLFDTVVGATPNTTNGHVWRYVITINAGRSHLDIQDLQPGGTPLTRIIGLSGDMAFGELNVGDTATATLTIANTGSNTLTVEDIVVPAGFSVNWTSGDIAASGSQDVTVTFSPTAQISYNSSIQVVSNATSGTATIAVTGSGLASPTRVLDITGNLAFGEVIVGNTKTANLTLTNLGNSAVTVTGLTYPTGFSGAWAGTIAAGASQVIVVTFAPVAVGSYGGVVQVASNQIGGESSTPISGTGATNTPPPSGGEVPAVAPPVGRPTTLTRSYGYDIEITGAVYDVTDYGAQGNGIADDNAAIRAAIAACKAAGGGHVYFPAGTYKSITPVSGGEHFRVDFGNVAFVGDGKALTKIVFYAFGGLHPQTDLVEKKGNGFRVGINTSTLISRIVWSGIYMDGQTTPNSFAGGWTGTRYKYESDGVTITADWTAAEAILGPGALDGLTSFPTSAVGWDINHKAIGAWGMTDRILVTDCAGIGWRGEIFYSGGGAELGRYYIARTDIALSNGSATSIGHRTIYDECEVWGVYNGVENFCRGISSVPEVGAQGAWLRNCRIRSNFGWPSGKGLYGVVYLGFRDSWLTIEDCEIDGSKNAAVFLSEYAHNVTIQDNLFVDCQFMHSVNLQLYPGDPSEEFYSGLTNILVQRNTFTTPTSGTIDDWFTNYNGRGVANWSNFRFLNNTVTGSFKDFYTGSVPPNGEWRIEDNDLTGITSAFMNIATTARRPTWSNNTQGDPSGAPEDYDKFSDSPLELLLTAPHQYLGRTEGSMPDEVPIVLEATVPLSAFPDGWPLKIYRKTESLASSRGGQVHPDDSWNSLSRGYGIYRNASLDLVFNAATQKFDLVSYTPPDTSPFTYTDTETRIRFRGWTSVTMNPSSAVTYDEITGLPENVAATITYNANVTIQHQPGLVECPGGVDFAPGTTGTCNVIWDGTTFTITT